MFNCANLRVKLLKEFHISNAVSTWNLRFSLCDITFAVETEPPNYPLILGFIRNFSTIMKKKL